MTRVISFDGPHAAKRFDLLWASLQLAGDGKGERTPALIRKEARLQDTFEGISEAAPSNGNGNAEQVAMRTLVGTPSLIISQEDFDLLLHYSEKAPWTPRASRDVVDLWDFLSTCPKQD